MKYVLNIFLSILLFTSCIDESDHIIKFDEFPSTTKCERIEISTPPLLYHVGGMAIVDNLLVTLDLKNDVFFQVFELKSMQYLGEFVRRGKGPDEEVMIVPYFHAQPNGGLLYQSNTKIKIVQFDISNNQVIFKKEIPIPGSLMDLQHAFLLGDNICGYRLNMNSFNQEFLTYNPESKLVLGFGPDFPNVEQEIQKAQATIFSKVISVKPSGDLFAAAYSLFPIVRIYDSTGLLVSETRYSNNQRFPIALIDQSMSSFHSDEIMNNYWKIKSTEKYIYAL